jgi:signal transduction histidine kinase
MRPRLDRPALSLGLTAVLLALLPLLAVLQYRWIGRLSEAERERMQVHLRLASNHFAREFDGELTRAALAFRPAPPALDWTWERFAAQHAEWLRTAPAPEIVRAVYAIELGGGEGPRLMRSNPDAGRFEPEPWNSRFAAIRETFALRPREPWLRGPMMGRGRPPFEWGIAEEFPALVLWLPRARTPFMGRFGQGNAAEDRQLPLAGCLVLELDLEHIRNKLLPELARRHFAGLYHVAVVSGLAPERAIYTSHPEVPFSAFSPADAWAGMFSLRPEERPDAPEDDLLPPPAARRPGLFRRGAGAGAVAFPPGQGRWRLFVRHPTGSLDAAVAGARMRNLAISFGILLLMGATVATIVVSARRAQNLARLQMEFVAGISHDLLTPLAVIRSAADNLADGLVEGRPQVGKYGDLIRRESRGLSEMVRQTLDYASLEHQGRRYDFRPLDAAEVIRQALEACGFALRESGLEVAESIAPDLPPVTGDAGALTTCVRNLLTNALKYGRDGGRIEIAARKSGSDRHAAVEIEVADRGPGIDPADLPRIFDPFYRGREAAASRIHGAGLGLSLVKRIVEAHGGTVAVKSAPGQGSAFTLRIPAAREIRT